MSSAAGKSAPTDTCLAGDRGESRLGTSLCVTAVQVLTGSNVQSTTSQQGSRGHEHVSHKHEHRCPDVLLKTALPREHLLSAHWCWAVRWGQAIRSQAGGRDTTE